MLHCKQTSVEEASTTFLLKEQTRIRTMGFPRKVTVKGFRPLSSTAALASVATHGTSGSIGSGRVQSAAAGSSSTGGRKAAVRASEMIDTQKSKVPLKWAASNLVPPSSTYTSTHGAHPGRSPQVRCIFQVQGVPCTAVLAQHDTAQSDSQGARFSTYTGREHMTTAKQCGNH